MEPNKDYPFGFKETNNSEYGTKNKRIRLSDKNDGADVGLPVQQLVANMSSGPFNNRLSTSSLSCESKNKYFLDKFFQEIEENEEESENSIMACHISNFPEEVLRHVFQFLAVKDKLSVSLVCHKWLEAINDSTLLDDILITISSGQPQIWHKKLIGGNHVYWSRRFSNFKFIDIVFSPEVLNYLKEYGAFVKLLILDKCKINQESLQSSIDSNYCYNLKKLAFIECIIDIFHTLPYLLDLHIDCHAEALTDHILVNLDKATPRLKIFSLFLSSTVDNSNEIRETVSETVPDTNEASKALTLPALLSFFESKSKSLVEVDLNVTHEDWHSTLYNEFLKMNNVNLRKLVLDCFYLADISVLNVINILSNYSAITELTLSSFCCNSVYLENARKLIPNLKSLTMECTKVTHLKSVFSFSHLQTLRFSKVNFLRVTSKVLDEALKVCNLNKLKRFELRDTNMKAKTLMRLLKSMTALDYLVLQDNALTIKTLQFVCERLIGLRTLHITFKQFCLRCDQCKRDKATNPITADVLLKMLKFPALHTLIVCPLVNTPATFESDLLKNNPNLRKIRFRK